MPKNTTPREAPQAPMVSPINGRPITIQPITIHLPEGAAAQIQTAQAAATAAAEVIAARLRQGLYRA